MPLDDAGNDALLRLATFLADPAGWFAGDAGLDDGLRDAMAASPVLRPLLNRWLAERSGTRGFAPDAAIVAELGRSDEVRQAVMLLTAPEPRLLRTAQVFGAALWADRLRLTVLQRDRERLAQLLGADAFGFGLRRAPVVARALSDLGLSQQAPDPVSAGYALCGALVARARRDLFGLFRLRRPDMPDPVPLTERQAQTAWSIVAMGEVAA